MDYSKHALSNDTAVREEIARRLLGVGVQLEQAFEGAQDVEGWIVGKDCLWCRLGRSRCDSRGYNRKTHSHAVIV